MTEGQREKLEVRFAFTIQRTLILDVLNATLNVMGVKVTSMIELGMGLLTSISLSIYSNMVVPCHTKPRVKVTIKIRNCLL